MATTFDVYSSVREVPLFTEVSALACQRLNEFAAAMGLGAVPNVHYTLHDASNCVTAISSDARMVWKQRSYVWFQFGKAAGGTDAYCREMDDSDVSDWEEEIEKRPQARRIATVIEKCLETRHRWYFRRSMSQPAIVNLGYGFLAASLAEMTNGFIYSDDGAWDFGKFPCLAEDFYGFYFNMEKASAETFRDWTERNIASLRDGGMQA